MDSLVTANVRQRPVRTIVSVIGVGLGVCLVMLFTGLADGMSSDLQRRSSNLRAEIIFTKPGSIGPTATLTNVSLSYVDELKAIDGVESAIPVILYPFEGDKGFGFERAEGVDWEQFAKMNGNWLVKGRAPQAFDEVVIDETKARNDHLDVGSTMKLFTRFPFRVTGIYAPESGARVKMSLAAMQDALLTPGKATYILVKARDHDKARELLTRINEQIPGQKVQMTPDVFTSFENSIPALGVFLRTLVGLAAVVSALVVMLAMYTTITERTREIGILKALGASRGYIVSEIEKEALLISFSGLVIGFIASIIAGFFIHRVYGLLFEYHLKWALSAAIIGLLGAAIGALYPALRAANLDPVKALSYD